MGAEKKIAVVVRDDLMTWQKLNVTAFTVGGIAGIPGMLGESYVDGDDRSYLPMLRLPVMVFTAPRDKMRRTYQRALNRGVQFSIYNEELFETYNDEDNRKAVRNVLSDDLNLVGLAMCGERKAVDKVVNGLKLHE